MQTLRVVTMFDLAVTPGLRVEPGQSYACNMSDISERDRGGRFVIGGKPGPGRPKGARSRLSERFLEDLASTWEEHGPEVLQRLARDKPAALLQAMVMLMPKHISLDASVNVDAVSFAEKFKAAMDTLHEDAPPGLRVIEHGRR